MRTYYVHNSFEICVHWKLDIIVPTFSMLNQQNLRVYLISQWKENPEKVRCCIFVGDILWLSLFVFDDGFFVFLLISSQSSYLRPFPPTHIMVAFIFFSCTILSRPKKHCASTLTCCCPERFERMRVHSASVTTMMPFDTQRLQAKQKRQCCCCRVQRQQHSSSRTRPCQGLRNFFEILSINSKRGVLLLFNCCCDGGVGAE